MVAEPEASSPLHDILEVKSSLEQAKAGLLFTRPEGITFLDAPVCPGIQVASRREPPARRE